MSLKPFGEEMALSGMFCPDDPGNQQDKGFKKLTVFLGSSGGLFA
jgi:hypothetical protein